MTSLLLSRQVPRLHLLRASVPKATLSYGFSTSQSSHNLVGKVQEAADTVNKKAGQVASKGIEGLETASNKVKQAANAATGQAKNVANDAKHEFGKTKESAKGLAQDAKKRVSA